ncbi:hypothetical protein [Pelagibaculum spongiae]|uniref:Uncharacterized protein n=1 Tax=Pelagibaculum spongiae TaxID=2080658 RepID=A0A2V1GZ47_9GAMM|nr:hypothetical protein [Pelagibaculum spongiae]PVZ67782.1 hypothetical protein DC094_15225 [Pelagibaculum spongiae]
MRPLLESDRDLGQYTDSALSILEIIANRRKWRMIVYKGKSIDVWQPIQPCVLCLRFDCSGFALNTWKRFGYSVYIDYIDDIIKEEFQEITDVANVFPMDFVVLYKNQEGQENSELLHMARVFSVTDSIDKFKMIGKYGIESIKIDSFYEMFSCYSKYFNEDGKGLLTYKFFREKNLVDRPKLSELLEVKQEIDASDGLLCRNL